MTPMLDSPELAELHTIITVATWFLWLMMLGIATLALVHVSHYFTGESPQTLFGAIRTTLLVAAVVYFTYDVSGYFFALMMRDPANGIRMPEHYTYWDWMREPLALKWHVLGFVSIIRYLPIVFAFCAGAVAHVFLLDVPYHIAAVVFFAQVAIDAVALLVLSFILNTAIRTYAINNVIPAVKRE
jgi:hypothetical protein